VVGVNEGLRMSHFNWRRAVINNADFVVGKRSFFMDDLRYHNSDNGVWYDFKVVHNALLYRKLGDGEYCSWTNNTNDVKAHSEIVRLYYLHKSKEKSKMSGELKKQFQSFIEQHGNTLFFIALVILLDHYLFEGALRDRLKKTTEGLLDQLPGGKPQ
jgi:hypothetical protein